VRFDDDPRTVLTLDAGGTNFVFSALRGNREVAAPRILPAPGGDLPACLEAIARGFAEIRDAAGGEIAAISFAFPGPADYPLGIIGDLGNLPAFRGGVPLGPILEERFGVPVLIHNDGDLFTYGESIAGLLPQINADLKSAGSPKRFRNLLGFTLGTGFGGGIVHDGRLLLGDNSAAGEVWLLRHKLQRASFAEEGASIRAVRRAFATAAGIRLEAAPEPKEILAIGLERAEGDTPAAREAFRSLGEIVGDAIANALTLVDGLVVLGGGLAGAAPLFLPALMAELNGQFESLNGVRVGRLESRVFNLEDPLERETFLRGEVRSVRVPGSARVLTYDPLKRVGVGLSRLGTSRAVALGAYAMALGKLEETRR
jgi:glucokinase